jgi:hypothetical protein
VQSEGSRENAKPRVERGLPVNTSPIVTSGNSKPDFELKTGQQQIVHEEEGQVEPEQEDQDEHDADELERETPELAKKSTLPQAPKIESTPQLQIMQEHPERDENGDDDKKDPSEKKGGRRKINIEFIENKSRRHVTFSKRKAGLIKKAYELSTLTGTQVLLLVASETGNVYTFATPKLQPLITKPEGKTLIQACLNPSEAAENATQTPAPTPSPQPSRLPEAPAPVYSAEKSKAPPAPYPPVKEVPQPQNIWNTGLPERLVKPDPKMIGAPGMSDLNNYNSYSNGNPTNSLLPSNYPQYSYGVSSLGMGYHGMPPRYPYHGTGSTFSQFNGAAHPHSGAYQHPASLYFPSSTQFPNNHLAESNSKDSLPNL